MSRSLPEMGDWDAVFDETYLQTYLPVRRRASGREPRRSAPPSLAEVEPGAEILDCPTASAATRSSSPRRATASPVSTARASQLAEAERRRGDAEWPRLVRGDYRELPFEDASFDAVFNLFSSLGYLERDERRRRPARVPARASTRRRAGRRDGAPRRLRTLRPAVRTAHVGAAPGRLALPRGAHARLGGRNDRHLPGHRHRRRASGSSARTSSTCTR